MKKFLAFDFGGSTIDVIVFSKHPFFVHEKISFESADFPEKNLASIIPFLSNFWHETEEKVVCTGGKTADFPEKISVLGTQKKLVHIPEFFSIGAGGLLLSEKKEALVVSLGTGTAMVHAKNEVFEHVGGTGMGGGTFVGLCFALVHEKNFSLLQQWAERGNTKNLDLSVGEIVGRKMGLLSPEMTASHFAKFSEHSEKNDIVAGVANLVGQSIATLAVEKCRRLEVDFLVVGGKFSRLPAVVEKIQSSAEMLGISTTVPLHADFMTVIGATV